MDSESSTAGFPGRKRSSRRTEAPPSTGRALISLPKQPSRAWFAGLKPSHGVVAAGVATVMGLGFVGGTALFAEKPHAGAAIALAKATPVPDTQMDMLHHVQDQMQLLRASLDGLRAAADTRQTEDSVRALKRSVDTLKADLEGVKAASNGAVNQLSAKIDRLDRDPGPKLAEISARLDKVAELSTRVERIERQVSAPAATGSIAAPGVAPAPKPVAAASTPMPTSPLPLVKGEQVARADVPAAKPVPAAFVPSPTGPLPPKPETVARADTTAAKPETAGKPDASAKPATVDGWLLRDVYGGVALVEGRAGLREVAPGEYVPGVGEIRSIERRGRAWVVVTSRGLIQADNRW